MCGSGCSCGPCAEGALYASGYGGPDAFTAAALAYDRAYASAGASVGEILPNLTTPESLQNYKDRLQARVVVLEKAAYACRGLTGGDGSGIGAFIAWKAGWDAYYATSPMLGVFGTASMFSEGQAYEKEMQAWETQIKSFGCSISGVTPANSHPDTNFPTAGVAVAAVLGAGALLLFALKR